MRRSERSRMNRAVWAAVMRKGQHVPARDRRAVWAQAADAAQAAWMRSATSHGTRQASSEEVRRLADHAVTEALEGYGRR